MKRVAGGWLRFNPALGRLDGHCEFHGPLCKMDRRLRKGTVGLTLAWLAAGSEGDKAQHVVLKATLSGAAGLEARAGSRAAFAEAAAADPEARAILEAEKAERGGQEFEPPEVACPAPFHELARALAAPGAAASSS